MKTKNQSFPFGSCQRNPRFSVKKGMAVILLLALLLTGCGNQPTNLMEDVPERIVCLAEQPEKQAEATDFALRLFRSCLTEGENTLVSPLSVLAALGMTANGARGDTLDQMEQTLGMSVAELNAWIYCYMEAQSQQLKLANSIWFRDGLTVGQDFLETNADFYQADMFQAAFTSETCGAINDWVSEKTDGMIPQILDEIPADAVMYLVNALAFEAEWPEPYREDQVWESVFTREDGAAQTVELMYSEETVYLEDENAAGFLKYYSGGRYAFAALLPKEGLSVAEYVQTLTGEHLQALLSSAQETTVYAAIPKFEAQYGAELSDILQAMGMTDAFDEMKADFTGISQDGGLFISRVLHKSSIAVAEQGTRAGAATAVEMREGAAMLQQEPKTVILDRPFVYMLIDCEQNLPFFLGALMDVGSGDSTLSAASAQEQTALREPPAMEASCGDSALVCNSGEYDWTIEDSDGTACTVVACGASPTDSAVSLPLLEADETAVVLDWDVFPESVTARCWADADSPAETAGVENGILSVKPGTYIYEITAVWEQGTASYAFRVSAPEDRS